MLATYEDNQNILLSWGNTETSNIWNLCTALITIHQQLTFRDFDFCTLIWCQQIASDYESSYNLHYDKYVCK